MLKFSSKKLESLMASKGLGPQDIGSMIGRDKSTVSNWVAGVRNPNPKSLRTLAERLQIDIKELLS